MSNWYYFWQYVCPYHWVLSDYTSSFIYQRSLHLGWCFIHGGVFIHVVWILPCSTVPKWSGISLQQVLASATGTTGDKKEKVFVSLCHLKKREPQRDQENRFRIGQMFLQYHSVSITLLSFCHQFKNQRDINKSCNLWSSLDLFPGRDPNCLENKILLFLSRNR